jgi:importin subunit alpha-1
VKFLGIRDHLKLQYEAAWVLANVASGSAGESLVLINCGAVPLLVEMLKSPKPENVDTATVALGNIMLDSPSARDVVLAHEVVPIFCEIFLHHEEMNYLPLLKTVSWAMSNIYGAIPRPPLAIAEIIIEPVLQALHSDDLEIVKDCCWTLLHIAKGDFNFIDLILKSGTLLILLNDVVPRFLNESEVILPVVGILGNVAAGTDEQIQSLLDSNALPTLLKLLDCSNPMIVKEICTALSNITTGTDARLKSLLKSKLLPKLIPLTRCETTEIRTEALWVFANVVHEQVMEELTKFDINSDLMILKALKKFSALGSYPEQNTFYIRKCVDTLVLEGML